MSLHTSAINSISWKPAQSWPVFILITVLLLWTLHALAFFPHEYAHSFSAWLLGWKANPLALNYGHLTVSNLLAQFDIDENVNYQPIFAGGHGVQAAIIAAAGMIIGNGFITYTISWWGYYKARKSGSRTWALFFYWFWVASIGNFIDYVPARTFAPTGDMHTVLQGLHGSPWWLIAFPGIPFALALLHFFFKIAPDALCWLFPASVGRRVVMVLFTALAVFGFYGAAGMSGGGKVSHLISVVSVYGLLPLMTLLGWWLTNRVWLRKQNTALAN